MPSGFQRRAAFSCAFALAAVSSACSLLVATDDLTDVAVADSGTSGRDSGGAPSLDASGRHDVFTLPNDAGGPQPSAEAGAEDAAPPGSDGALAQDAGGLETGTVDAGRDSGTVDAGHDAASDGAVVACGGDLSNIGKGDLHITFDLRTTQSGVAALLNQRTVCGSSSFWDLRLSNGHVRVEADDGTNTTDFLSTGPALNDGATHSLSVVRTSGVIAVTVDGAASGAGVSSASLGALAPLATGADICDGKDGTVAFQGTLSSVCVTAK